MVSQVSIVGASIQEVSETHPPTGVHGPQVTDPFRRRQHWLMYSRALGNALVLRSWIEKYVSLGYKAALNLEGTSSKVKHLQRYSFSHDFRKERINLSLFIKGHFTYEFDFNLGKVKDNSIQIKFKKYIFKLSSSFTLFDLRRLVDWMSNRKGLLAHSQEKAWTFCVSCLETESSTPEASQVSWIFPTEA